MFAIVYVHVEVCFCICVQDNTRSSGMFTNTYIEHAGLTVADRGRCFCSGNTPKAKEGKAADCYLSTPVSVYGL